MPEKGKESNKQTIRQLPDRYPRTEEILVFWDMSELDHVFDSLDKVKENANSMKPDVTPDKWNESIDYSCIYGLIGFLRKACFEYERFWIDEEDWNLEDDEEFNECMNDPDELQWLVTDLDFGRVKPVNGKDTRFYEPAYHAAARSLQMAMYAYKYPGDNEWLSYCINELKQTLTRYHAAALEIVMHRNNAYLHNNQDDLEIVRKIRARSKKRADDQKEEAAERRQEAIKIFDEFWKNKKDYETKTSIVEKVASEMNLSVPAIWRYLSTRKLSI